MSGREPSPPQKKPFLWDLPRTRVYLIRHGQVEDYEQRRFHGQNDIGLSDFGRRQYDRLARRLLEARVDVEAVYASDLTRAQVGGRVLSGILDRPLTLMSELRELHFGAWEGLNYEEIQAGWAEEYERRFQDFYNHRPPEGETIAEMEARVWAALTGLVERHRHRCFLVVAHSGVNRVTLCRVMGLDSDHLFAIDQDYGCLNVIDFYDDGRAVAKLVNGVSWDAAS